LSVIFLFFLNESQQTRELKDQLLITADLKFIIVKSIMIFQIIEPVKFLCNVTDADAAIQLLCQSILRDVVGYHTLEFLNTNKNSITGQMQVIIKYYQTISLKPAFVYYLKRKSWELLASHGELK
jgi:regulator of protease activity HflC (stomatin/prohibitin superfamily)